MRKLCESACACMMFAKSFGVLISYAVSAVGESDLLPGHKFRRIRARGPGFDVSRITLCVFVFCVCVQGDISKSLTMLWRECKQHPCFVGHREVQVADQNHILPLEKQKSGCVFTRKAVVYSPRKMLDIIFRSPVDAALSPRTASRRPSVCLSVFGPAGFNRRPP